MTNPYNPLWGAYSFMDVYAVINGPGAQALRINGAGAYMNPNGILLGGPQAASAEEGITLALQEETNTMTVGADGSVMHSLHASRAGTATFRLLKISPYNNALQMLYNHQRLQSNRWGRNTILIYDFSRGDSYVLLGCAFVRFPNNSYAKVGNIIEYEFHCAIMQPYLGTGEYHGGENMGAVEPFGGLLPTAPGGPVTPFAAGGVAPGTPPGYTSAAPFGAARGTPYPGAGGPITR